MGRPDPDPGLSLSDRPTPPTDAVARDAPPPSRQPRYHPLGEIAIRDRQPVRVVMCLRCGAVVVAMEVARHDLCHIEEAEGNVEPWSIMNRPLGF